MGFGVLPCFVFVNLGAINHFTRKHPIPINCRRVSENCLTCFNLQYDHDSFQDTAHCRSTNTCEYDLPLFQLGT